MLREGEVWAEYIWLGDCLRGAILWMSGDYTDKIGGECSPALSKRLHE
jgi:hypothetical protein